MARKGKKKQSSQEQGLPSGPLPGVSHQAPQPSASTAAAAGEKPQETLKAADRDQPRSEEWTKSTKGKKKQSSQEQGGPSGPLPGASHQAPQPSTSTAAAAAAGGKPQETGRAAGTDQPRSKEWTKSSKGDATGYKNEPLSKPGDTRDRPTFQGREHHGEGRYQSGRGWEKSGGDGGHYQQKPRETFRKSDERVQQRGDLKERPSQQWSDAGPQQRPGGGRQWQDRGYQRGHGVESQPRYDRQQQQQQWQRGGQQWRGKGHEGPIGRQQGHIGGQQQYRSKEQQGRKWERQGQPERQQSKEDPRPTERQYQPGENPWGRNEDTRQKPQSPKVAEESADVWQAADKDAKRAIQQFERAEGAPDKVQHPSTSTSSEPLPPSSESEPSIPLVPVYKKPGTLAIKRIKVQSNHFALNLGDLKEAYHYHVNIVEFDKKEQKQPEKSKDKRQESRNRKVKNKVQFRVLQEFLKKYFPDRYPSFDGEANLYASKPLKENLNEVLLDTGITVVDDFGKEKTFSIEIRDPKIISLVPQVQAGTSHPPMLTTTAIQCIDIVLRNAPIRCFNQIGSSFFSKPKDRIIELGGGMEMYYGFYQSVIRGGRPFLNVHLVHKAFPKQMPVLDAFIEILNSKEKHYQYKYEDLASLQPWQIKALNSYIHTLKVAYEIPTFSKVIYRVNELAGSPKETTMIHNGTEKTILEYFRTEKRYPIKYPELPLLWVGNPKGNIRILIPPELCTIEKDQSVKRKMEDFQTSNMIKEAATDTHKHRDNTMDRFNKAEYNTSPCVQEFRFSVSDKFEVMDARILPTPRLQYDQQNADVRRGTWQNKQFLVAKRINKWAIVNISNDRYVDIRKLNDFVRELKNAARSCGVNIESEPVFDVVQSRNRYGPTKADVERYFAEQKAKKYDIIFVIIPSSEQGNSIYSYVKRAAELTAGCLTQCVKAKTLTGRFTNATATNILLKVNGKLDGINHTFTEACKPKLLRDRPVMIMGADVTHPGPTAGMMPSVAAIIASHDPKAFQYNLCLRLQEPKMEYIGDLKAIVKEQLEFYFKKNNGIKPEKIIFFRDGVSEGQFQKVLSIELTAIKEACNEYNDYNPAITFLVVQKRHHTRLFPLYDRDSEDQNFQRGDRTIYGNYNVPAGTCVDTTIVDPQMQYFYLVSHASIKGVSRPTKYCTLYDDLDMTNDEIEELSYYLCHMFARCNRSVSYPAPTYYAHLGALRGKAYIKPALDDESFDMDNLQKEMANIKIQFNILNENPMFFI